MIKNHLLVITLLFGLLQSYSSVAQITLNIEASRTTGVAPLYVFFDATATSGLSDGNDLVNSDFSWNFDTQNLDPNGSWEITKGMISGHVFELPGTYEVSCTITVPNGTTEIETLSIVVSDFDGTTYYVSAEGDNNNNGLSSENSWITAEFAFQQLSANEQILFRRGDVFSGISENLNNRVGGPMILGAYGSGDNPILSGDDAVVIDIRNSEDLRVMDLHIIPTGDGNTAGLSSEGSENILALRLEIEQTTVRTFYQDDAELLGIFDCNLHDFGVLAIFSGDSRRLSFVGNEVDNLLGAPQPEHGMRIQGGEKQFIAHNTLTRLDDTKTAITIRGDGQRHVMIYRNKMDRILGVNPANAQTVATISNVVIEGNYIGQNEAYVNNNFGPTINGINIEATHIAIRNNIIDGYRNAIFVGHDDNGVESGMVDVYHNTINWRPVTEVSGNSGRIVRVRDVSNVNVQNNLISAADQNNIEVVNNDNGSTNISASTNLVTSSPNYVTTTFAGSEAHLNSVENYLLSENSPAIDVGNSDVPVFFDLFSSPRINGAGKDVGAFEYGTEVITGVKNKAASRNLVKVYPNPFSEGITIENNGINPYQKVEIHDHTGKLLFSSNLKKDMVILQLSQLENGLYYIIVSGDKLFDRQVIKVLKKRN